MAIASMMRDGPGHGRGFVLGGEAPPARMRRRIDRPVLSAEVLKKAPTNVNHPARKTVVMLLTNRAHPDWSWSNLGAHRVAIHNAIAG